MTFRDPRPEASPLVKIAVGFALVASLAVISTIMAVAMQTGLEIALKLIF